MKTTVSKKIEVIAAVVILFFSIPSFAGEDPVLEEYRKETCLHITGKIDLINEPEDGNTYKVELIYFNKVLKVLEIKESKTFKFSLKRDSYYTIRISKKGYVTKLISIDTNLDPEMTDVNCKFRFDTTLMPESDATNLNPDALDFPVALIYYNENQGQFDNNNKYTASIKRQLYSHNTAKR